MDKCRVVIYDCYVPLNEDARLLHLAKIQETEVVSDKIPALLCFFDEIALHVTRPIRWDSDHVVLFDDETKEMAKEILIVGCEEAGDGLRLIFEQKFKWRW